MNNEYRQHSPALQPRLPLSDHAPGAKVPVGECRVVRRRQVWQKVTSTLSVLLLVALTVPALAGGKDDDENEQEHENEDQRGVKVITMMEIGDHHGTMVPRPNLRRGDSAEFHESGLAKEAYIIKQIRKGNPQALLFNSGDTIQGSAEVLYTSGQAIVDVLDTFGINGYAPGNWDWLYGKDRAVELFGAGRWGVMAANAYDADTGERLFPAYRVYKVKGVKIGVIGMTAERGLPAVPTANVGILFTDGVAELQEAIDDLRNQEKVDIVVLLSELGLAKNTLLVDQFPGVDVVFSSDMHEETPELVVTPVNKVLAAEIGWGGSRIAKLDLLVKKSKEKSEDGKKKFEIVGHNYEFIAIEDQPEDRRTKRLVAKARAPFLSGPQFQSHVNPISGHVLDTPIDTVVGLAGRDLFRGNFANGITPPSTIPGVLEGTSHAFITDAFRQQGGTEIGTIRGFRYGTYVRPGEITLGDLYTYLNAGAKLATGDVTGEQIKTALEGTIRGSLDSDPFDWGGGWLFGFSGVTYDVDPNAPFGSRAVNAQVNGQPLDPNQTYSITGYFFDLVPDRIGAFRSVQNVSVITKADGSVKDPTEVVADYLQVTGVANPQMGRTELLGSFPPPVFENPEIQPLRGVLLPD